MGKVESKSEARERAKKLYCEMAVVRFDQLSARVGTPVAELKRWAKEDLWLDARARKWERSQRALTARLSNSAEFDEATINICDRAIKTLNDDVGSSRNAEQIVASMKTLKDIVQLRNDAWKRLTTRRGNK